MKKLAVILVVLSIVFTTCILGVGTVATAAAESPAEDFLVYDGVLEEYVGDGGDVVIPASLGVKEIAAHAFENNLDITSVVIPEGVEVVGYWAFKGCENIEAITLPYSLEVLAEHCFSSAAITEIVIPGNVEVIGYGAFSGCNYLTDLTVSYGVREIQILAFQGTSISVYAFPETVEMIAGGSMTNNRDASIGKIEVYISNPDCEIGGHVWDNSGAAAKHQWTGEWTPWSHNAGDAQLRIYVLEGSKTEKWVTENLRRLMDLDESSKGDSIKIVSETKEFFAERPENQKGYGKQPPEKEDDEPQGGGDKTPTDGDKAPTDDGDKGGNTDKNTSGGTQTIIQGSSSNMGSTLIIIICVFGGIMLLAIVAVVILLATGKLSGSKAKPAEKSEDAERIEKLMAKLEEAEKKLEALEDERREG